MIKILFSLLLALPLTAAIADDELNWELDFEIKEKSTLDDFPLQEIGGDELSNAAIEGALQTSSNFGQDKQGKPAYSQEEEADDKRKVEELDSPEQKQQREDALQLFGQFDPNQGVQLPDQIYQTPNGRTYGHLETNTVERP